METILRTINLSKRYGSQQVVDQVNLNVREGEIYGFLGRNGAGKTTTIRMLLGLIRPTGGEVELFGDKLQPGRMEMLRRIGSMVETPGFYGNLTARENLQINARILGKHSRSAVDDVLELVGLEQETKKRVSAFSLGMKQRLGIARALLHYPELLILDEPTNGLDPIGIKEMRKLIRSLAEERKISILISSHILPEIEQLADRMGILHQGRLLEEVAMEEVRTMNRRYLEFNVSSDSNAVVVLERELGIRDYEVRENGEIRIYSHLDEQARLNRTLVENGIDVYRIALSEDRLEDYFTRLVGGGTIG